MSARRLAVIAGSGMGPLCAIMQTRATTPFAEIDGVGACGVDGHAGEVRAGAVSGRESLLVLGRRHGYEGGFAAVERLVAFLSGRGATDLLVTSAAGALWPTLHPGDLVLVSDLLDRQNRRARCRGEDTIDTRSNRAGAGDATLAALVERSARAAGVRLHRGVAVSCLGPAYETAAEVAALQVAGADVATMSGAPEVEAAARHGLRAAAVALVTNPATGIAASVPNHAEVLRVGTETCGGLARLIQQLVIEL